jgi:PAS domain S-box-containing protein
LDKPMPSRRDALQERMFDSDVRSREDRFRAFVTASSNVVYRMSADWKEMQQLDGAEFIADTNDATTYWMDKYIHPDDRSKVQAAIDAAIDSKSFFELEHRVLLVDGSLGWTHSRAVPLLDADGRIIEWIGAARDITQRKRIEAELADLAEQHSRQSRLFDQIASATPDFIYTFDKEAHFRFANRRLLEVWARTLDEAVGRKLLDVGYPDWHAAMHEREIRQVIATKLPIKGEVPFTGGSGISGVYEYIFTPVLGRDGEVELIAGTTRDVTERRRGEQLLVAQNRALELLLTGSPLNDVLSALVQVMEEQADSKVFATIRVKDEVRGTLITAAAPSLPSSFIAAIDNFKVAAGVGTCAHSAATNEVTCTPDIAAADSWKDQAHLPLSIGIKAAWATPMRALDGRVLGTFGIYFCEQRAPSERETRIVEGLGRIAALAIERAKNEQEREELLRRERAARAEAERASRMKDEFLSTLSHELRTPLHAILGWSQVLTRRGSADLSKGLEVIERNARAQTQIIDDLLDMSRIVSGKVRLDVQRVDLAAVARLAVDTVRPGADAKGVRLQVVLDPLAGPINGDPNRLQQVLWNILSNAVKFTPRGGRVQVLLERINSHLELSVVDSGQGIAPEFLPHVFDRFSQADASNTRRHAGLGLGLAIVKQLVELHGGSVRAKSAGLSQGATFSIKLPLQSVSREAHEHSDRRHPSRGESVDREDSDPASRFADFSGLKMLVVDDEADARALMRRLFEDCRATVLEASSAPEALTLLRTARPDVLVSDIGMPGESGYMLIRRIRALPAAEGGTTPAVALTAYARTEDRTQAILAGFQHHVAKPVEPAELIAMVASLTQRALLED